jgi:prepilin-type N-terminal cleavage/methylation domain-containing protein
MNRKNIKNNNVGFTLVEMLVSIFIIATMSTIFLVNYHSTNKRSELGIIKQKVASDIRLVQNYSLGSKTYDGVNVPSGGWGIRFATSTPDSYIIFADINENKFYDQGEAIETKTLPAGITVSYLSGLDFYDIVFLPPDPECYINGYGYYDATAVNYAHITLRENINNTEATIWVGHLGMINPNFKEL